ncbi:D-alanyl-D-alanine carboxypeptidase [Streptomyces sp. S.PNR 29]|uniref:D-alanyl-D-alanine carboxypeptidase n=1 Tax=Streptomyces sp. S.PNR 29 TaxID=2973805 RepID=UPI0025B16119|nr:D-alanyl-D-alanine carboxypeptidase [Streptomyces sp. S.PNR 29]MDN0194017.1 D-alanyl-D-alanine carboxypeptidase [Streptomyces sp. S.PNR 29]
MEEASVAGESPDRSKQRESSAEPTSGSAGPVPEARSEAAETRDPRLAVAREASRGGVDTATRVLSTRAQATETDEDADPDADAKGSAADSASEASSDRDATTDTGGGRLKDAVAAWVRSADEAGEADGEASADADADEDEDEADQAADADPAKDTADADAEPAKGTADAEAAADTDRAGQAADAEGSDGAEVGEGGQDAEGAEEADAGEETERDAETASGADAGEGGREDDRAVADADAEAEADTDTEPEPEADADEAGEATDPRADAGQDAPEATEAEASKEEAGEAPKAPTPKAPAPKSTDDSKPTGTPEAATPETDPDGTPEPGDTDGPDEPEASGDKAAKPPVDQPTAVFKAVRPAVDQPTTMLKVGGVAKVAEAGKPTETSAAAGKASGKADAPAKPEPKPEPGPKPEPEAERTSKFVALKPLDDPSTRKPPPADATTALPKVPPADATAPVPQVGPERTTQQPLPPKPPLDLLAELTNTPPPPPTPLRTLARRVKIWTPLVLLLVVIFAVVQTLRPLPQPTLDLTAKDSYAFEGSKVDIPWPSAGQAALDVQGIGSFGSSGEQKPVPIASVAKVMTAYLILRDHPLKSGANGPKLKIDQTAEDQSDAGQESTVPVTAGDSISQREALESILIASANNIARLLARWDAGSEKAFVTKMNDAAKDLGMKNTTYTDPSGLNNTTVSTAVDQVKLAKEAMKQPAFREVAAMMSYTDYKGANHPNWNQLVGSNNVVGIKTGTTTSALGNLVFAAKKEIGGETRTIVGAVVRQPDNGTGILAAALDSGDKLIRAAQSALESATILKKGDVVGYADDGLGGRTPVVATEDVKAVGWAGLTVKLTFKADELPHTAKAGTEVGTLTVGDGGTSGAVQVPVALQKDLVEPGWADKLTRLG